jgi:hypothetical protein
MTRLSLHFQAKMRLCVLLALLSSILAVPLSHPSVQPGNLIQYLSKAIHTVSSPALQLQDDPTPKSKDDEPKESIIKSLKSCLVPAAMDLLSKRPAGVDELHFDFFNITSLLQAEETLYNFFGADYMALASKQSHQTQDFYNALLNTQKPAPEEPKHWVVGLLTSIVGAGYSAIELNNGTVYQYMSPRCNCQRGLKDVSNISGTTIPENICQGLPIMWSTLIQAAEYRMLWDSVAMQLRETRNDLTLQEDTDLLLRQVIDLIKKEIVKVLGTVLKNDGNGPKIQVARKWAP